MDGRRNSSIRRVSSNTTISSASASQVYTDQDLSSVTQPPSKKKFSKLFNVSMSKHSSSSKSSTLSVSTTGPVSAVTPTSKRSGKGSLNHNYNGTVTLQNSSNGNSVANSMPVTAYRQSRSSDGHLTVNNQPTTSAQTPMKTQQRKDIKITNCHEKDGIWTATGQFGRESRHSKRTEISYDRKKFRFTQKDDQGNKSFIEIPASDIEGKVQDS